MNVLKHLFVYISRRKRLAFLVIIVIVIAQLAELLIPLLIGITIDNILNSLESDSFQTSVVITGVILIAISSLVRGIAHFFGRYLGYLQGEAIIKEIRSDLFRKYETSSLRFFDQHRTGDLMSRATTDLEPISEFLVWGERILLQAFLTYTGIYLVLLSIDFVLFLLIAVVTPTLILLSYWISRILGPLYFDLREKYGELTAVITENISGAQIVRAFHAEDREKSRFDKENLEYMKLRAYAFKIRSFFLPMILLIINFLITILIYVGGSTAIQGSISPGLLIALFTYFTMLAMPTRFLAFSLIMYQRVVAAGNRVFSLLEDPSYSEEEEYGQIIPEEITPDIVFEDVSFNINERPILSNISLEIKAGERVAILGSTGSGKSSLISLIPRFQKTSSGRILIRYKDRKWNLEEVNLSEWRKKIGFVHQEPFLFGRTVAENLLFELKEINENDIQRVLKVSQLSEFIDNLSDGIDTLVGERGVTLSGGQKQRLAIARMLLRRNPIMIFDDSTSSLDIYTEAEFLSAFQEMLELSEIQPTVITITQRLSTLKNIDRIIILNKGRIIEQGTHEELLEKGEIYPLLWKTQESGQVDIKLTLEKIIQDREEDE
ncbi:MAG: ABC transporter ATP-binding protein [Candidatus Hodarchaeales archaeon]